MAYSQDYRQMILEKLNSGYSYRELTAEYGISRSIIQIDESGFKKQTYRPYAYAPRGQVCHGNHNWQIKNTSNAIGALYQNQLIAVGLYEFSIHSDVFYSWVQNVLLPQLPHNSV